METKDALGFTATVLDELAGSSSHITKNFRVQKILFFAHLLSLKKYRQPLVQDRFKAWENGPVLIISGGNSGPYSREFNQENISEQQAELIRFTGKLLQKYSDDTLEMITHEMATWEKYVLFKDGQFQKASNQSDVNMPNEELIKDINEVPILEILGLYQDH